MTLRRIAGVRGVCAALMLLASGPTLGQAPAQQSVEDLALFRRPPPEIERPAQTAPRRDSQSRRAAGQPRGADTQAPRTSPQRPQPEASSARPTPAASAAPPEAQPAARQPRQQGQTSALVARFGSQGGTERMVLAWPNAATPELRQNGDRIEIVLPSAPNIDEGAIIRGLMSVASAVSVGREGNAVVIRITANPGIGVRADRSADRLSFEFSREPTAPATAQAAAPAAPAQPAPAQPAVAPAAQAQPAAEPTPTPSMPTQPASTQPAPAPVAQAPASDTPRANERTRPGARERAQPPGRQRPTTPPALAANPTPAPVTAAAPSVVTEPPPAPAPAVVQAPPVRDQVVRVDAARNADGIALRFNWDQPVPAAVFARGPTLWIVFDSRRALDLAAMRALTDELGEIDVAIGELTAVRIAPSFGVAAAARREGDVWVVDLLRRARPPASPIEVTLRRGDANRPRFWAAVPGAQRVVRINDPEIGDAVLVAPTAAAGHGVDATRSFVQFRLPVTAQGLVIEPRSDDLQVQALGGGIDIATARGMIAAAPAAPVAAAPEPRRSSLFDLDAWRGGGPTRFMEERMALQRAVTVSREDARGEARVALAQFLFAHGFAVDALGVLRLMEQDQPAALDNPRMRAVRGVAALLAGDLELAGRNLRHASLADHPEAILWRAMLTLEEGGAPRAIVELAQTRDISDRYPAPFANRLGLAVAELHLAGENIAAAEDRLALVLANQPSAPERSRAEYLRGQVQLARGQRERAFETWARVEQGPMMPARVLATLARIEAQLEDRTIEPRAAVEALDRLRFNWRGDMLEFRVLARLGRLYETIGDTRRALGALRGGMSITPNHPDTATLRAEATEIFSRYVLDGAFERASPVAALALFEESRSLLPGDARRPRMVLRAAERMIGLDLLDRAAATLDRELREQISGVDRAQFGARLALVRLLDHKPQAAIDALALSASADAAPELLAERQLLEARALIDLEQIAPALALIADDRSEEADRLRADMQLRMRDWAGLAATLTRLAGEPRDNTLSDEQARTVLHLSVATVLSDDAAIMRSLRERFTTAMQATRYKDLYEVLTGDRGPPPEDMRAVAARVTTVAPFQTFLAQYRDRLARPASRS
jgi:tetratricopeptide (TPR) repeat protein